MLQYRVSDIGTPSTQTQLPQYVDYRPAAPKVIFYLSEDWHPNCFDDSIPVQIVLFRCCYLNVVFGVACFLEHLFRVKQCLLNITEAVLGSFSITIIEMESSQY